MVAGDGYQFNPLQKQQQQQENQKDVNEQLQSSTHAGL